MNKSNFLHGAYAVLFQIVLGLLTGNLWIGAAFSIGFFFSREQTQKQYRRQQETGESLKTMAPWVGLDFWRWDADALGDWLTPVAVVTAAALFGPIAFPALF